MSVFDVAGRVRLCGVAAGSSARLDHLEPHLHDGGRDIASCGVVPCPARGLGRHLQARAVPSVSTSAQGTEGSAGHWADRSRKQIASIRINEGSSAGALRTSGLPCTSCSVMHPRKDRTRACKAGIPAHPGRGLEAARAPQRTLPGCSSAPAVHVLRTGGRPGPASTRAGKFASTASSREPVSASLRSREHAIGAGQPGAGGRATRGHSLRARSRVRPLRPRGGAPPDAASSVRPCRPIPLA